MGNPKRENNVKLQQELMYCKPKNLYFLMFKNFEENNFVAFFSLNVLFSEREREQF